MFARITEKNWFLNRLSYEDQLEIASFAAHK